MSNKQKQSKKMKNNGQADNIEIIPDLENEMIEEQQPRPEPIPLKTPKKGGCGCQKNKASEPKGMPNWIKVAMVIGGLVLIYFMFKKKKGKIEVPKVEVPEV